MGITERREREKAELKEQILKVARGIVLKEGFEALSMRKIAQAIEYSPATIYLHFPSREEIAKQLTREAFAQLLGFFAPLVSIKDPMQRVKAFGRAYVKFGLTRPESYRLIFMTDQNLSTEVLPSKDTIKNDPDDPGCRAFLLLADAVRELVDSKRIAPLDPELGAHILWASVHGVVSLRLNCPEFPSSDINQLTETFLEILQRGLEAGALRRAVKLSGGKR